MKRYTIHYTLLTAESVTVEAESEEAAKQLFNDEGPGCGEEGEKDVLEEAILHIVEEVAE